MFVYYRVEIPGCKFLLNIFHNYLDFQGIRRNDWIFLDFYKISIFSLKTFIELKFNYIYVILQIIFYFIEGITGIFTEWFIRKRIFLYHRFCRFIFFRFYSSSPTSCFFFFNGFTFGSDASWYLSCMFFLFICLAILRLIYAPQLKLLTGCSPLKLTRSAWLFATLHQSLVR